MKKWLVGLLIISMLFIAMGAMFMAGYGFYQPRETIKEIQTVITRYPNTPPYEALSAPIDFDQALILLHGMRESHVQVLNWEFESDPGFGIADKDLQRQFIKWYDQLIDIFWRMEEEGAVEG